MGLGDLGFLLSTVEHEADAPALHMYCVRLVGLGLGPVIL